MHAIILSPAVLVKSYLMKHVLMWVLLQFVHKLININMENVRFYISNHYLSAIGKKGIFVHIINPPSKAMPLSFKATGNATGSELLVLR